MNVLELKKNFYSIGYVDHALKVFDVAVLTNEGTSYNSYLLKTPSGTVVWETVKAPFVDAYLEHLQEVTSVQDIKYLFVTHTEPDHSGSIARLLDLNPNITIVASPAALINLSHILRRPFNQMAMNPAKPFSFGGYTFQFVSGLMLHWPDVMFTYIPELKVLISCDAFGGHFASDAMLLSKEPNRKGYYEAVDYYFDHIMAPFASFVVPACDRVASLDIDMICPGHGPVIDQDIQKQIQIYRHRAERYLPVHDPKHVTIVYASAYGYTRKMAEHLRDRFTQDGKQVSFYEIDALNYEKERDAILNDIRTSGTLLLGSPTLVGDAISLFYDLLSHIYWTMGQGKKASAFGDYGWSGEAVKNLSERLTELHFKVIPGFRFAFALDEEGQEQLAAYYETLK